MVGYIYLLVRESWDLYGEMKTSGIIRLTLDTCYIRSYSSIIYSPLFTLDAQVVLVFGQMNETPGCRMRTAHTALGIGEFFRDAYSSDVLIFIDNVFRFVQAGS